MTAVWLVAALPAIAAAAVVVFEIGHRLLSRAAYYRACVKCGWRYWNDSKFSCGCDAGVGPKVETRLRR